MLTHKFNTILSLHQIKVQKFRKEDNKVKF
jgi:hypothetical protein